MDTVVSKLKVEFNYSGEGRERSWRVRRKEGRGRKNRRAFVIPHPQDLEGWGVDGGNTPARLFFFPRTPPPRSHTLTLRDLPPTFTWIVEFNFQLWHVWGQREWNTTSSDIIFIWNCWKKLSYDTSWTIKVKVNLRKIFISIMLDRVNHFAQVPWKIF